MAWDWNIATPHILTNLKAFSYEYESPQGKHIQPLEGMVVCSSKKQLILKA
jgi:hypothetical protein